MTGFIDGVNFSELDAEKYWSFTASYSDERKRTEALNMVYSGDYLGARKMDGAYYRFWKDLDGNMGLQGRSKSVKGIYLNKIDWVPQLSTFFDAIPNGTCLLGELYFPKNEGSYNTTTIMGCKVDKAIARQKAGDALHYYVFDVWAYDGKSFLSKKAEDRFSFLKKLNDIFDFPCVEFAKYFEGSELWEKYQSILADGGEGVVITKKDSLPEPGKRRAKKTLKLKKELQETLDVVVIGANPPTRLYNGKELVDWVYWQNIKTFEKMKGEFYNKYSEGEPIEPITKMCYMGGAGSLKIGAYKDGKMIQIGNLSGLDEEVLLNWKSYVGKVIEITAMEVMKDTYGLRHPRAVGFRDDKNPKDCDWYRIFENE